MEEGKTRPYGGGGRGEHSSFIQGKSCPHPDYFPERHGPMRETMDKDSLHQSLHVVEAMTDTGSSVRKRTGLR